MQTFVQRITGAMALDPGTFEEVEADRSATAQAMGIVVCSSLASGLTAVGLGAPLRAVPVLIIYAVSSWVAWAVLSYQIGSHLLPARETRVDVGELLRTIGFASAPGCLLVFGIVSPLAVPLMVAVGVWMTCAMVMAVRQALDFTSTRRAIAVCLVGLVLSLLLALLFGSMVTPVLSV